MRARTDFETMPTFLVIQGETWMYCSDHPEEACLTKVWPGPYLTADGVRFPAYREPGPHQLSSNDIAIL